MAINDQVWKLFEVWGVIEKDIQDGTWPSITTGWRFQIFFIFTRIWEDSHFDYIIFFKGVETTN